MAASSILTAAAKEPKSCDIHDIFFINLCYDADKVPHRSRNFYILYDVNPVEGFNLRRDVYLRMATFVYSLRSTKRYKNTKLVLPPFWNMYHWRSKNLEQERVPWSKFFDLDAMREFTEVLDFPEFLVEIGRQVVIDEVYRLQPFDEMFENGVFVDKFEQSPCRHFSESQVTYFGSYSNITRRKFSCVNFQGGAKLLRKMLYKYGRSKGGLPASADRIVLILNTETILHDFWGTSVYWEARRSMRFNKALTQLAAEFRENFLNSTLDVEAVQRPMSWRAERPYRGAIGGPYIAAHLRRADFLYGREKTTPSLLSAATQLKRKLRSHNVTTLFLASDCTGHELLDFKNLMRPFRTVKYTPESRTQLKELTDGGVAIVDQIIASYSR